MDDLGFLTWAAQVALTEMGRLGEKSLGLGTPRVPFWEDSSNEVKAARLCEGEFRANLWDKEINLGVVSLEKAFEAVGMGETPLSVQGSNREA